MANEEWRDIPTFEGRYQISDLGRVKSLNYKGSGKEGILKTHYTVYGHLAIKLQNNGRSRTYNVHQLMAMGFMGHMPCGHERVVDHINNIPDDNRLENLQIISARENSTKDRIDAGIRYSDGRWVAYSNLKGKRVHLGMFKEKEDAQSVFELAVKNVDKLWGHKKREVKLFRKYIKNLNELRKHQFIEPKDLEEIMEEVRQYEDGNKYFYYKRK